MAGSRMEVSVSLLIGRPNEKGRKRPSGLYHGRPKDGGLRVFFIELPNEMGRRRLSRLYHGMPKDGGFRGFSHRAAQ